MLLVKPCEAVTVNGLRIENLYSRPILFYEPGEFELFASAWVPLPWFTGESGVAELEEWHERLLDLDLLRFVGYVNFDVGKYWVTECVEKGCKLEKII